MPPTQARDALVYEAIRLPRGRVRHTGGTLAEIPAYELVAQLLRELSARGVDPSLVDDLVLGVSTASGEHSGVSRVGVMAAGWPDAVPGGTVSRQCCSGLDALGNAAARVGSGMADVIVAGGVESMSRVPMLGDRAAFAVDAELSDLTGFVTIGVSADATALEHQITRSELDAYAVRSHERSLAAPEWTSVVPVRDPDGQTILAADEGARPSSLQDLAGLAPLFSEDPAWTRVAERLGLTPPSEGLHTAATAPQMCDAASVAVVASPDSGPDLGREPIGRILAVAHAGARSPRLDGVVTAAERALGRAGIRAGDVDLAEINESFSVTPVLTSRALGIDPERVNPCGGAISVGHPLGATGGVLLANALEQLGRSGGRYALLAIPAALGLGTALVVERL